MHDPKMQVNTSPKCWDSFWYIATLQGFIYTFSVLAQQLVNNSFNIDSTQSSTINYVDTKDSNCNSMFGRQWSYATIVECDWINVKWCRYMNVEACDMV